MERSQLEAILNDPASTPAEKTAAQAALDGQADPVGVHDHARMMLAALNVERIADLNEETYERYCVAHFVKHSDPIVREFRYWLAPSFAFLDAIGLSRRDYWTAMHDAAKAANRPDVQAHVRDKLRGLETQP